MPDQIRVGGPAAPSDSKVAVVGSADPLVGEQFTVVAANGRTVMTETLQAADESPSPWQHAARADFSAVTAPGSYVINVGGRVRPGGPPACGPADLRGQC
jgi:hypothetical protein